MRLIAAVAVVVSLVATPAFAAQGEVCSSKPDATGSDPLANTTVFKCEAAGEGTISDLYSRGWRVVAVFPQVSASIRGPAMRPATEWALVIEKL